MAPNRKKKPASNPARGFATTSICPKLRPNDEHKIDKNLDLGIGDGTSAAIAEEFNQPDSNISGKDLREEEPDAQLNQCNIHFLLQKYGAKTKKVASHQLNKLRNERRMLRPQSERLDTSTWLPEGVVALILKLCESQIERFGSDANPDNKQNICMISDEDLIVKIWTLELVLSQIGFNKVDLRNAIQILVRTVKSTRSPKLLDGRDLIWGLEECIDYLVLYNHPNNFPAYDFQRKGFNPRTNESTYGEKSYVESEAKGSKPKTVLAVETPSSQHYESMISSLPTLGTNEKSSTSSISDESEDDIQPEELIKKYISLQRRVFLLCPGDISRSGNKTPLKSKSKFDKTTTDMSPELVKLHKKLERIKSDILFDQSEASAQWLQIQNQLVKELAERKKLQLGDPWAQNSSMELAPADSGQSEAHDEDEVMSLLGDIFETPSDTLTPPSTNFTGSNSHDHTEATVKIRDFGKWTGVSPRRLFESACKSRDSSCKVTYTIISDASFSYRHKLLVEWSCSQEFPCSAEHSLLSYETSERQLKIQMNQVSTPNADQSEAYISTAALFLISVSNPKEEKLYLRLPTVWRNLWIEMSDSKKEQMEMADLSLLRELRSIVLNFDNKNTDDKFSDGGSASPSILEKHAISAPKTKVNAQVLTTREDDMKKTWASKTATPVFMAMLRLRKKLPIWDFKKLLLETIGGNQAVIVCGETGCGKSTQVPAFILEHEMSNGRHCKIYCTQPRRISAISLARRVSEELGERKTDLGTPASLVGYAIRLESRITNETKLIYATIGVVMRILEQSNDLSDITHLILDEVHERSIDGDFLLIVLRMLLVRRPALKVVLMSATVDAERLSNYLGGAPIIQVPGRTFPVIVKYLEDALEATGFDDNETTVGTLQVEPSSDEEDALAKSSNIDSSTNLVKYSMRTRVALAKLNEYQINYHLILKLIETIASSDVYTTYSKAILIFLPGLAEIRRLNYIISSSEFFAQGWSVYPLHSSIAIEEQEQALLPPPNGIRKIVLATNIAETGITIPDVTCVVDTGKHREFRYDERRQLSRLIESFISKASAKQRRGRAGRVQPGLCFHLFTKLRFENQMPEEQTPEMLRLSLQDLVLRVKICKIGDIEQTLSNALDPPSSKNIQRAICSLMDAHALTAGEELTHLGRQLAKFPLDVFLGKLVLLGTIYRCLDGALSIAAILSSKSPFSIPIGAGAQADLSRLAFKKGESDLLTVYNAYSAWRKICGTAGESEQLFCRKSFLDSQTLYNIEELKTQLLTSLIEAGLITINEAEKRSHPRAGSYSRRYFVEIPERYNTNNNNERILASVIAWSFYPKLITRDSHGWRNILNNQIVHIHPKSVNKGVEKPPKWLSFYHIMQSSNKSYYAHETSSVEDFAIAIACGHAEFKMYSGVIIIDGNRIRFSADSWKVMLAIKVLRAQIRQIVAQSIRKPGWPLSHIQQAWMRIWQIIFSHEARDMKGIENFVSNVLNAPSEASQ